MGGNDVEVLSCGMGNNDQKVLVLTATNTPYALDQAIRRHFDKRTYIPLPELKARQHMFKVHLGDTPHNLTESDFEILAGKTEGFSGSDISVCVKDVLFEPVRKTQDAMFFIKTPDDMLMPRGPKQPGAVQASMQELAAEGLASKRLAYGEWFTARVSSCGLFHIAYPSAPELLKAELRSIYDQLCQDDMPMVRRSVASNLGKYAAKVELQNIHASLNRW